MLRIPKTPSKILLEIINVEKFQIKNQYTKKSVVFLYANNELAVRGIKETIPLIVATKKSKHLGNKLNQEDERFVQ